MWVCIYLSQSYLALVTQSALSLSHRLPLNCHTASCSLVVHRLSHSQPLACHTVGSLVTQSALRLSHSQLLACRTSLFTQSALSL